MNMPRKNVAAAVLDGVLYAVGGTNENYQDLVTVEKFDFDTGMWSAAASLTRCKGKQLSFVRCRTFLAIVNHQNFV